MKLPKGLVSGFLAAIVGCASGLLAAIAGWHAREALQVGFVAGLAITIFFAAGLVPAVYGVIWVRRRRRRQRQI